VYIHVKRSLMMPMLELMDAPSPTQPCARRAESTVATQALMFLNGEFVSEHARFFAERVRQQAGADAEKQIDRAFWLAYARPPTAQERARVGAFLAQQRADHRRRGQGAGAAERAALTDLCQVLLAANEFVYVN